MVKTANEIWRDFVMDAVPSSGDWDPDKSDIREWGTLVEGSIATGNPVFAGKAILIGLIGDSRAAGSNASIGTAGLSAAVDETYVWNPDTSSWRDASVLGVAPYALTGDNNPARAISSYLRKRTGKPVFVVQYGVAGSNIWQWLDPAAAHGQGSDTYFSLFESRMMAALASPELQALGVSKANAMMVVLGANNGNASLNDFAGYMQNMIDQCRQTNFMPGSSPNLPILWMEMQHEGINSSLHNQTVAYMRNKVPYFGVVTTDGVSDVGDQVHEDSRGIELLGVTTYKAANSIDISYPDHDDLSHVIAYPGGSTGDAANNPWDPPRGFRDTVLTIRTAAVDVYTLLDPQHWRLFDSVVVSNSSTGGGIHYIVPPAGVDLGHPDRPGFYATGVVGGSVNVAVLPGESIKYVKITDTKWEVESYTPQRQPYLLVTNSGTGDKTYASGAVLTGWVAEERIGLNVSSGEVTITVPGVYDISLFAWVVSGTNGYIQLQRQVGGAGAWNGVAAFANGNSTVTYARTISGSARAYLGKGDKIRFVAQSANVVVSESGRFTGFSVARITG